MIRARARIVAPKSSRSSRASRSMVVVVAMLLVSALLWAGVTDRAAAQRGERTEFGEIVKATRLLSQWRYEEARDHVAKLAAGAPDTVEARYLQAEIAFIDGAYERVIALLDGIGDEAAAGNVGRLRSLAASTYSITRTFASRESSGGHFVIFYPPGKDEVIVDLAGDVLEAAYRELGDDFDYRPKEKIRVELLSRPADLAKVSPLTETEIETTGTIALCKYGKLMVVSPRATIFGYPWMDTLVHEYVHYVVSRSSHDEVPIWLHEGLARFQQVRWRRGPDDRLSATDEHLLATALKSGRLITFDEMHPSMAKLPSQEAAALAFAEVYTMVSYIHERKGYDGIRRIIALTRSGKSARRAVAEVLGGRWSEVERDWKGYLRGRNLETSRALAGRASSRRIRFDKGGKKNGGEAENVGVDEVASEKARKYARLGGMLRARGMSKAAAIEYEKALGFSRDDPFIAGKLSRTYLELGEHDKAIKLAEPLHLADENDATPAVTLGLAYMALGQAEPARTAFEAALRVSPFDPAVRCSLADLYAPLKADSSLPADAARLAKRELEACRTLRR